MKKYRVTLEIDSKRIGRILAGLDTVISRDLNVIKVYPHLEKDDAIYKHIHETTELKEYIRERFIDAEVMPDEDNSAG